MQRTQAPEVFISERLAPFDATYVQFLFYRLDRLVGEQPEAALAVAGTIGSTHADVLAAASPEAVVLADDPEGVSFEQQLIAVLAAIFEDGNDQQVAYDDQTEAKIKRQEQFIPDEGQRLHRLRGYIGSRAAWASRPQLGVVPAVSAQKTAA